MAKGSQSQASTTASKGGSSAAGAARTGPAGTGPRGTATASGLRRRRTASSGSGAGGGFGGGGSNMLRFYTDDAPGLKISPTVVLVMSLCFIGFVTALHVAGKLYSYKSGGA
jgi:protein transport protein SEC61 subunit beta